MARLATVTGRPNSFRIGRVLMALMDAEAALRRVGLIADADAARSVIDAVDPNSSTWSIIVAPETLADRIERLSIPEPNSGCWIWNSCVSRIGYGRLAHGGKQYTSASRAAYLAFHGPIQEGMHVLHRCDTRCCVNPDHLFLGTHAENMADMARKGRRAKTKAKVSEEQVLEIRKSDLPNTELARRYGVLPRSIAHIREGKTWRFVV